ncbi:MAG: CoA-transferase [Desulfobacterales bacterium]|nr:CoA-transferase [Desulfobacterales bacterium]
MNTGFDKVMNMSEAIKLYVADGSHISIGGFTINRNPMAAVYEIIRQKIKDLHLYAHSNGQGIDELIGGECVSKLEIAYGGNGRFAPTCIRFKKAVTEGTIIVEDYSNYQMTLRFLAGAMGVPFLPTRSSLGTDIIDKWGFSEKLRKSDHKIPDQKLTVIDNPFTSWTNATKVVLVPAINTDVTIIHVQKSDRQGTARIEGLTFADIEQAKSAKHLIITCEELVESEELRKNPDQNQIPFFCVDAVVHVPFGAFPTASYRYYDYDPVYLNEYKEYAADDLSYKKYLEKFVYGVKDHQNLLDLIGKKRMEMIKADPRTGYAAKLDRR